MNERAGRIAEQIRLLLSRRAAEASICPSEVARAMETPSLAWRAMMPAVRDVATEMARDGEIRITQGEAQIDPTSPVNGAIRLRRGPNWRS